MLFTSSPTSPPPSQLSSTSRQKLFSVFGEFLGFLFGRLQQSFPEGIIKPYEGTSLTIGKVCRRPICYRISSHFG